MNKTSSILKNVNFWGIVICNLIAGNVILFFHYYRDSTIFVEALCMSISAILVYFILFKNVNFAKKTNWKLLFYSFISSIFIFIIGNFFCGIIFSFTELLTLSLLEILKDLFNILLVIFMGMIVFAVFFIPMIVINFLWLLKEKHDNKKKNKTNNQINIKK